MEKLKFKWILVFIIPVILLPTDGLRAQQSAGLQGVAEKQQATVQTLEECQKWAAENYPLIKKYDLISRTTAYSVSNAARAWIPQVNLSAEAAYYSAVPTIPDELLAMIAQMGYHIDGLNKDQYKIAASITQRIWDGGASTAEKKAAETQGAAETASTAVDVYSIKEKVNSIYFGALVAQAQGEQNDLQLKLLQSNFERVNSYLKNGTATQSDADAVEAELLASKQTRTKINAAKESYLAMLSIFTGHRISNIAEPEHIATNASENRRPELEYLDKVKSSYDAKRLALDASVSPTIGLSLQGFYGNPSLDMFKDMMNSKWRWSYVAGIKLQWSIGNFYTKKNKLQQIKIAENSADVQRETFLFNTSLQTTQQQRNIEQKREEMREDAKIIRLRESVRKAEEAKLANGTIEVTDLLRYITEESNAKISESVHRIELLKAEYDLRNTVNN